MTFFAYFQTPDNTIAELALSREDITLEAFQDRREEAAQYVRLYSFSLIGIFREAWTNSKWDHEYARLERSGYYTRERQEELFDTVIVGTLDRLDI